MSSNRLQPLYLDGVGLPALPEGWSWKRFEDVVHAIPVGRKYDGKAVVADGVTPVIDQSVSGFMGHHNDEPGVMASALHPVFTFANHTCAMRWMTSPFSCIQNVFAFKGDSGFETQYLFYAAQGRVVLEEYKGHAPVFRSMLIPVPPFNEQRNIATFLASLDERITLLRETNATLEAIAQALFKSWFVDFDPVRAKMEGRTPEGMDEATAALFPDGFETSELGEVPRGWRVGTIGDFAQLKKGSVNPGIQPEATFEHFSLPSFDTGQRPIFERGDSIKSNKTPVTPDAVLLSKLNPHIPRIWLPVECGSNAVCSTEFLVFVPTGIGSRELIYCAFSSPDFIARLQQLVTGTSNSHQRIKPDQVALMSSVVPTAEVAREFEAAVNPIFQKVFANREQVQTLATLRDALLPRLISGSLHLPSASLDVAA